MVEPFHDPFHPEASGNVVRGVGCALFIVAFVICAGLIIGEMLR